MKVIIIGAGIGGLSAYLSLKKYLANDKVTIKIYESHGPSAITGVEGSLSLAPNGLRAIASLSPKAIEHLEKHRYTDPIQDSSGRFRGHPWNGRRKRYRFDQMILCRAVVHEALLLDVPADAITWYSKLQSIEEDERGVEVVFANGSSDIADLVIGADGIWSVVRECISGEPYAPRTEYVGISKTDEDAWQIYYPRKNPPVYDGFTGVSGSISLSRLSPRVRDSLRSKPIIMTSGPSGLLFGYSRILRTPDDDPGIKWWSIYESITPPDPSHSHPLAIRAHLLSQYASWKSRDFPGMSPYKEIIKLGVTTTENFYFLSQEQTLREPFWSSPSGTGRILLLGDAAHVVPYKSRQGASSAIEDAVAIGILLHKFHEVDRLNIKNALKYMAKAYKNVRMERVWRILSLAKKIKERKRHSWLSQKVWNFFVDNFDKLCKYNVEAAVQQYVDK